MEDVPVACSLDASNLSSRMNRWNALTDLSKPAVVKTDTGLRLAFSQKPDITEELTELAELERACCGFASWSVRQETDSVVLDISASSEEGITAIHGMFATLA